MNARLPASPQITNTSELSSVSTRPVAAASSASLCRFAPRQRETSAFAPTPVPTATAICSICAEYASDAAVSASSLMRATKMLSTMLYIDCTTIEIMIGTAIVTISPGTGATPILFSFCIFSSLCTKNA